MKFKKEDRGFDELYYEKISQIYEKAVERGVAHERIEDLLGEAGGSFVDVSVPIVTSGLRKSMPKMLRQHRRRHRQFERRVAKLWGKAFDLYYATVVVAEEVGGGLIKKVDEDNEELNFRLIEAVAGLHARACRTALEVYHLLVTGLPMGALARSRTLHELAVIATFLSEYGSRPDYADLAEKYLQHDVILSYKDLVNYQKNAVALGYDEFSAAEVEQLKADRDDLRSKYGKEYLGDNGWAADVFAGQNPRFVDLEEKVRLSHRRDYYKWASHEVHADSKGWRLNKVDLDDGGLYMSTGYGSAGLAEPADLALMSLANTTTALIFLDGVFQPTALVAAKSIMAFHGAAVDEFSRCDEIAEKERAKFFVSLNRSRSIG